MRIYSDINFFAGGSRPTELATEYDAIDQNILLILMTPANSTWMEVGLGCNVQRFLFDPVDTKTAYDIRSEIITAIPRNGETRAQIKNVMVVASIDNQDYYIEISYTAPALSEVEHLFSFNIAA